jgi:transmembrane sensor
MTEQSDQRYLELAEKWLRGTISPAEMKEYAEWYNTIDPDVTLHIPAAVATDAEVYRLQLLEKINARIQREAIGKTGGTRVRFLKRLGWAAAASLILLGAAVYFSTRHNSKQPAIQIAALPKNDILPGGNKAILTLAGGRTIILDSTANGTLAQQGNSKVQKLSNRQLSYSTTTTGYPSRARPEYNTLSTPRGGQYQLTLSDGTSVWLNSASSVTYPTTFTGKDRSVTITGEVYFEVADNKDQPFKVFTASPNNMEIEVLGTHFNINAYSDETEIKTTLLAGRVKVSKASQSALLSPGEQAQANKDGSLKVAAGINTEEVMAWKNGLFQFDSVDIHTVMRELARWYDVDIRYEGPVTPDRFSGKLPRDATASEVLTVLEKNQVHFRIEGKKIIVMP